MRLAEIALIIDNLKSSRWSLPLSPLLLHEFFGDSGGSYWIPIFKGFEQHGFNLDQVIFALSEIVKNSSANIDEHNRVGLELVWTGPTALNSTLRNSSIVSQDLFRMAKSDVLIATYVIYQGREIFKDLGKKIDSDPNFNVTFIVDVQRHGNTSIEEAVLLKFKSDFCKQWPAKRQPHLYYFPRSLDLSAQEKHSMHAKCVIVDSEVSLITSANFTQAAHHRNIEAGALIHSRDYAARLKSQFLNLIENGTLKRA